MGNHCRNTNPELWQIFFDCYTEKYNLAPTGYWNESDVIIWLDLEDIRAEDKYYNTLAEESDYYAQF